MSYLKKALANNLVAWPFFLSELIMKNQDSRVLFKTAGKRILEKVAAKKISYYMKLWIRLVSYPHEPLHKKSMRVGWATRVESQGEILGILGIFTRKHFSLPSFSSRNCVSLKFNHEKVLGKCPSSPYIVGLSHLASLDPSKLLLTLFHVGINSEYTFINVTTFNSTTFIYW